MALSNVLDFDIDGSQKTKSRFRGAIDYLRRVYYNATANRADVERHIVYLNGYCGRFGFHSTINQANRLFERGHTSFFISFCLKWGRSASIDFYKEMEKDNGVIIGDFSTTPEIKRDLGVKGEEV